MKKEDLLSTRIAFLTVIVVAVSVVAGLSLSLCSRTTDIPVLPTDVNKVTAHDSAMIRAEEKRIMSSKNPGRHKRKGTKTVSCKKTDKPEPRNYLLTPEQELPGHNNDQEYEQNTKQ